MSAAIRVLVVDDSESDAELVVRQIRRGGYEVVSKRVETAAQLFASLKQEPWDLVIADYQMPQFNAQSALAICRASASPRCTPAKTKSGCAACSAARAGPSPTHT